jgi:SPP1 family predicted phage head-tail adaptor
MATAYAIAAGKLPHRVTVQQLTQTTKATTGDQTETWTPRETVWAAIEPVAGNERFASAQIQGDVTHMITIRPIADIKSSWRLTHEGRTFHITQPPIDIMERGRKMVLMCKEMTD